MALTYKTNGAASSTGSTTTVDCTVTVAAGDCVIAFIKHEGTATTASVATSGGSDAFTAGTYVSHSAGAPHAQAFYLPAATVSGSVTYRATLAAARTYKRFIVVVFTPDAGTVVTLDAQASNSGTGTSVTSGNVTLSGTDIAVVGFYGEYSTATRSARAIAGSTSGVTVTSTAGYSEGWYKVLTSGGSGINASCTLNSSQQWVSAIVGLRADSSGPTGTASITEGADTVAGSGTVQDVVTGTASQTEGADSVNASGGITISGTASITEGPDTIAASGTVSDIITGTASVTEGADTVAGSGSVVFVGTANITEGADTVSASGTVSGGGVAGSASITEAADTVSASGTVQTVITGTASPTEAADTISGAGNVVFIGSASITEGQDTITASGSAASPVTGTVSITEGADTITATDRQRLSIIGNYEVNGVEKTIKDVGSLLDVIEAAADKAAARVAIGQFMTEHDINPQTYVLSSLELKALERLS